MTFIKQPRNWLLFSATLLSGCNTVIIHPSGDIAQQQSHLILLSTLLMLIIIIPVIGLTLWFAWRYRQSNTEARYTPEWDHSTTLEVVIWGAPLLIISALGLLTWIYTHTLDPYRPLQRLDAARALPADAKPLEVDVVALDWKWLFIYPEQGIATVNELAAPVDRPISFKITASTTMNSFYIPALAGQIYAMPGMQTQLHAVINKPGEFQGFSANYSGAGFSDMRFTFHGLSEQGFADWVQSTRKAGGALNRSDYLQLERPSIRVPVQRFAAVAPDLFDAVLNRCVESGKMCASQMMAIDARGGMGPNTFGIATHVPEDDPKQPVARRYVLAQACTAREAAAPDSATRAALLQR